MKFLKKKWLFWINSLLLIFMVLLGLYLFNDVIGFSGVFQAVFGYAQEAVAEQEIPKVDWDWQICMLGGVFVGALCGALINGSWKIIWAFEESQGFSAKSIGTVCWGVVSGFLVMLGAILSGEAFYGQFAAAVELSSGAWFFLAVALISGGITALFLERTGKSGGGKSSGTSAGGKEAGK